MDYGSLQAWNDLFEMKGFNPSYYSPCHIPIEIKSHVISLCSIDCWVFKSNNISFLLNAREIYEHRNATIYIKLNGDIVAEANVSDYRELISIIDAVLDPYMIPLCIGIPWAEELVDKMLRNYSKQETLHV